MAVSISQRQQDQSLGFQLGSHRTPFARRPGPCAVALEAPLGRGSPFLLRLWFDTDVDREIAQPLLRSSGHATKKARKTALGQSCSKRRSAEVLKCHARSYGVVR